MNDRLFYPVKQCGFSMIQERSEALKKDPWENLFVMDYFKYWMKDMKNNNNETVFHFVTNKTACLERDTGPG